MDKLFEVGGLRMPLPVMVAAGVCKIPAHVERFMRDDVSVGAVGSGSFTWDGRTGNEGTLCYPGDYGTLVRQGFGLNSYGMPNEGEEALSYFDRDFPRDVFVSLAGFSTQEYLRLMERARKCRGISAIELNCGCPNAHDKKTLPMAYDDGFLGGMLEEAAFSIFDDSDFRTPVWLKLSPYVTAEELARLVAEHPHLDFSGVPTVTEGFKWQIAHLIAQYSIRAVVFSNTLPNVVYRENGTPVTTPNGGKAGLSGPIVKDISISLIREFSVLFERMGRSDMDLIGCGGILTGDDAMDYFDAGAAGVQCASGPFWYDDPKFFTELVMGSERLQAYLTA